MVRMRDRRGRRRPALQKCPDGALFPPKTDRKRHGGSKKSPVHRRDYLRMPSLAIRAR